MGIPEQQRRVIRVVPSAIERQAVEFGTDDDLFPLGGAFKNPALTRVSIERAEPRLPSVSSVIGGLERLPTSAFHDDEWPSRLPCPAEVLKYIGDLYREPKEVQTNGHLSSISHSRKYVTASTAEPRSAEVTGVP